MKTIGQILKAARHQKSLSIDDLATETRIRPDYIKAIEADQFTKLPSATFVKGFIRNLALALDVPPDTALAVLRRDYDQDKAGKIIPRGLSKPLKTPSRLYNPKTTTFVAVAAVVIIIAAYFLRQILSLTQAPPINLISPQEDASSGPIVSVKGSTASDAVLSVNQKPISLSIEGTFETSLNLTPGPHTIVVEAKSRDGKTRTLERHITVQTQP